MSLLERIFGNKDKEEVKMPNILFGRYSDSYKIDSKYDAWDKSLTSFDEGKFLESYRYFFEYLRDDAADNVTWTEDKDGIHFSLLQGSKRVFGFANTTQLKAEAKVVKADALNVGFMRRLMEHNYNLKYSRFALDDDNNITIVFDTYTLDGSPYKLYYALKEVATHADKQDDLLLDEFEMLQVIEPELLKPIPDTEKNIKYEYYTQAIKSVLAFIEKGKLNPEQYPGGIAYLLLDLCYRIDFLVKPEGLLMETLEGIHRIYFANDTKSTVQKNIIIQKELQKVLAIPKEKVFKEMYGVTSTFGVSTATNHEQIVTFIDTELHNMNWYADNGYKEVALAVPNYIVGYCLFNYASPKPDRQLFQLYFEIVEAEYFQNLGFNHNYLNVATQQLDKKAIIKAIQKIVEHNTKKYSKLNPSIDKLNFDTVIKFAQSFLVMIRDLDLTKTN